VVIGTALFVYNRGCSSQPPPVVKGTLAFKQRKKIRIFSSFTILFLQAVSVCEIMKETLVALRQALSDCESEVDAQLCQSGEEGLTDGTLKRWLVARKVRSNTREMRCIHYTPALFFRAQSAQSSDSCRPLFTFADASACRRIPHQDACSMEGSLGATRACARGECEWTLLLHNAWESLARCV
jgi:hypothetical protein